MLAYAAHRRNQRRAHPATLALIVGAHAVALGVLITARMEVGVFEKDTPLVIQPIPLPDEPPPPEPVPHPAPSPPISNLDLPPRTVVLPLDSGPVIVPGPTPPADNPVVGTNPQPAIVPLPQPLPLPKPLPKISSKPQLLTFGDRLKPPYPEAKRRLEEEATLRLRLSIDERGRVVAVEPVGSADPQFLAAARDHLIRAWRYKPALVDGSAIPSTITITLSFRLEDERYGGAGGIPSPALS
ncbi:MAG TPA: energy transducer TonB [Sphingomicrobium sp.]|nr:energy transducer TonB [Sphingomicrobium sp.]